MKILLVSRVVISKLNAHFLGDTIILELVSTKLCAEMNMDSSQSPGKGKPGRRVSSMSDRGTYTDKFV